MATVITMVGKANIVGVIKKWKKKMIRMCEMENKIISITCQNQCARKRRNVIVAIALYESKLIINK